MVFLLIGNYTPKLLYQKIVNTSDPRKSFGTRFHLCNVLEVQYFTFNEDENSVTQFQIN